MKTKLYWLSLVSIFVMLSACQKETATNSSLLENATTDTIAKGVWLGQENDLDLQVASTTVDDRLLQQNTITSRESMDVIDEVMSEQIDNELTMPIGKYRDSDLAPTGSNRVTRYVMGNSYLGSGSSAYNFQGSEIIYTLDLRNLSGLYSVQLIPTGTLDVDLFVLTDPNIYNSNGTKYYRLATDAYGKYAYSIFSKTRSETIQLKGGSKYYLVVDGESSVDDYIISTSLDTPIKATVNSNNQYTFSGTKSSPVVSWEVYRRADGTTATRTGASLTWLTFNYNDFYGFTAKFKDGTKSTLAIHPGK